jgi:hypothetical protein
MSARRTIRAVLAAFAYADEITVDQVRAAIYQEYSGAELMRWACRAVGWRKSRRVLSYIAGETLSEQDRVALAQSGINTILRLAVRNRNKHWFEFDTTRGVVRRVRT